MPMGIDEAWDDDVALGVDHLGAVGLEIATDGRDLVVLDEDVGCGHLAQRRVLAQDGSTTDEDAVRHEILLLR
jgi:hypothetical protein